LIAAEMAVVAELKWAGLVDLGQLSEVPPCTPRQTERSIQWAVLAD